MWNLHGIPLFAGLYDGDKMDLVVRDWDSKDLANSWNQRLTCERTESGGGGAAKKLTDQMRNVAVMRARLNTTCRNIAGSPRLSAGDGDGIASLGPICAQCLGILLGLLCWTRRSRDGWICKYILSRTKMAAGGPPVSVPGYLFGGEKGAKKNRE